MQLFYPSQAHLWLSNTWFWSNICHWYLLVSRNNLGELQKLLPPSVSTFDIWLMDSKFRNFPPLLFHPPLQNRLAKKPSWAARHDLNKNWANPAKCGDLLLTSQLIPAPLGGSWLRRWSVFWNIVNATTQQNKNEPVFHQLPERPNVSFILKSLYTLPLESPKSALGIIGPSSWVLKSRRLHHRRAGIHKNITQLSKGDFSEDKNYL